MQKKIQAVALALLVSASVGVTAREDGDSSSVHKTVVTLDGGYIYINAPGDTYQISGPYGFSISANEPSFDFGGDIPDGVYTFSVYKGVGKKSEIVTAEENSRNGRDADATPGQVYKLVNSGSFKIIENTISTKN